MPSADAAPSRTAAIARIPDPQPTSRARRPSTLPPSASRFERGEAEPRRGVQPGPECHPRVEGEDHVPLGGAMPSPGRADHQSPANPEDGEVLLPCVGPVGFLDEPRADLPDRAEIEDLEMPERGRHLGYRLLDRGRAGGWHVRPDGGRLSRVDARTQPLVHQLETRFDARSAGCHAPKDLADRLDRLEVRFDRQLDPGWNHDLFDFLPSTLSMNPPLATASPASSAYAWSNSRSFFDRRVGTATSTST